MQMRMLKGVCVSSPVCGYIQSRILFRNMLSECAAEGHANTVRFLTVPRPPLHTLTFGPCRITAGTYKVCPGAV